MRNEQLIRKFKLLILIGSISTLFFSCSSKSEKEAFELFKMAQSQFNKREYSQVITNITKALELTNNGESTWTIKFSFYNGEIHYLRAKAYEALGKNKEAIADYRTATSRGTDFISSHALNSDPEPGAKSDWFRKLSGFYNSLGIAYAKNGEYEEALKTFEKAIGSASGSVNRVGVTDKIVGTIFGGEGGKRKAFASNVGAYCYNVGLMQEKLGKSSSEAMRKANQLNYHRGLVVKLK